MCSKLFCSQLDTLNWEIVRPSLSWLILGFYWKAVFDPQDNLYKLVERFNQTAVQEIACQVSHISHLLQQHHNKTYTAIEEISRDVVLLRQETQENTHRVRRTSDLLEKMAEGGTESKIVADVRITGRDNKIPHGNRNY
jgi:hypothetical protein